MLPRTGTLPWHALSSFMKQPSYDKMKLPAIIRFWSDLFLYICYNLCRVMIVNG